MTDLWNRSGFFVVWIGSVTNCYLKLLEKFYIFVVVVIVIIAILLLLVLSDKFF